MSLSKPLFEDDEIDILYNLIEKLTGNSQKGKNRRTIVLTNIQNRMQQLRIKSVEKYLKIINEDIEELNQFISLVTIHTTSWFREIDHYHWLEENLIKIVDKSNNIFKVASIPCSSGEEVYSIGVILENLKNTIPDFSYSISGYDIDPLSIERAKKAIYRYKLNFDRIPNRYRTSFLVGSGPTEGLFTIDKNIRGRCKFFAESIYDFINKDEKYDVIFCRNLLIYFDHDQVNQIVQGLKNCLTPKGVLFLGLSESISSEKFNLTSLENSIYSNTNNLLNIENNKTEFYNIQNKKNNFKVLSIDDSMSIRKMITKTLSEEGFSVNAVSSTRNADECLREEKYNLITLDMKMPEESGYEWLKKFRKFDRNTPVVIISDSVDKADPEILELLNNGLAQDSISKDQLRFKGQKGLLVKVQAFNDSNIVEDTSYRKSGKLEDVVTDLVCIGASTGGPKALQMLLQNIPKNTPPIVITQHIEASYAKDFAESLSRYSGLPLGEIRDGEILKEGHLYLALGDYHIGVKKMGSRYKLIVDSNTSLINFHRPSVDYLFESAAKYDSSNVLGIILTGMGKDGAKGLLELKKSKAQTIAQDMDSSVVFGMPRQAIDLGAASFIGDIQGIKKSLLRLIDLKKFKQVS